MGYQIEASESVEGALRRIAHEQLDKALAELDDAALDVHETVHQLRKRCKKLRGLWRLVRPCCEKSYERENAWYRDTARPLSEIRDSQSMLDTFDELMAHFGDQLVVERFGSLRATLVERRTRVSRDEQDVQSRLDEARGRLLEGKRRIESWSLDEKEFAAVGAGLAKTYRRARQARARAMKKPSPGQMHEWRKRVKYNWYHLRLLVDLWPDVMQAQRNAADELADQLGNDRDLELLRATLEDLATDDVTRRDRVALCGLIDQRRAELRSQIERLGPRVLAEKPKRLCQRVEAYWVAWRREATEAHVRGEESTLIDDVAPSTIPSDD